MRVASSEWLGLENRLQRAALGSVLLVPLVVAYYLQPDPTGLGTHQQLGFEPCVLPTRWGIRCPACGMTTAWAHCVRGQWSSALAANVGGSLACLATASFALCCYAAAFAGWRLLRVSIVKLITVTLLVVCAVTLIDWIVRIFAG